MKLTLMENTAVVLAEFSYGPPIEFACKAWSHAKLGNKVSYHDSNDGEVFPGIFDCINAWWEQLDQNTVDEVESVYRECAIIIEHNMDIATVNYLLSVEISKLFWTFDWLTFRAWCLENGNFNLKVGAKDTLTENDDVATTYFTEDYKDLIVFSILLKALIPIWGQYERAYRGALGKPINGREDYVLLNGVQLIKNLYVEDNPAYIKLVNYIDINSKKLIKEVGRGYSILAQLGSNEIPDYLLAHAIWKKVCIFDPRLRDKSIVKDVHSVIALKCGAINRSAPNTKTNDDDPNPRDQSILEAYKVVQLLPPSIEVKVTHYLNMPEFIYHLNPYITIEQVNNTYAKMSPYLEILEFHTPILSWVMGYLAGPRNLLTLNQQTLMRIIAAVSTSLMQRQYYATAQILVTIPGYKDITQINYSNATAQIPMTSSNITKLNNLYSFVNNVPGITQIETIIKEVNGYTWNLETGSVVTLTNELADLLISTTHRQAMKLPTELINPLDILDLCVVYQSP